jgi:hypothetical protein
MLRVVLVLLPQAERESLEPLLITTVPGEIVPVAAVAVVMELDVSMIVGVLQALTKVRRREDMAGEDGAGKGNTFFLILLNFHFFFFLIKKIHLDELFRSALRMGFCVNWHLCTS